MMCAVLVLLANFSTGQDLSNRFKTGQIIIYHVDQESLATDIMGENSSSVKNRTRVTKEWKVVDLDGNNIATIEMRLLALVVETTRPNGEILKFDSNKPEGPLKDSLAPLVGSTVAKLNVDRLGRVLEVTDSKFGKPTRYETEPPFVAVLHGQKVVPGQTWNRNYFAVLEPPAGTGEKIELIQNYITRSLEKDKVILDLETSSLKPFKNPVEEASILQLMPKGTINFDLQRGLMTSAHLTIDKVINEIAGSGSSYQFKSTYKEILVDK